MFNRSLILVAAISVSGMLPLPVDADSVTLHESSDPSYEPSVLSAPQSEMKPWFIDCQIRIAAVLTKHKKLARGMKSPVICILSITKDGRVSQLSFMATGSQEDDDCAAEIMRQAAPFRSLPDIAREPAKVAVELGSHKIKMWQMN